MIKKQQIFLSHTKKDVKFCDLVYKLFAGVSLKAFRSEYENIKKPEWQTIKNAMSESVALFFVIGPELAKNQQTRSVEWVYTQNWIAYEIGLACQLGIDVWAIVDGRYQFNFPMPYINNYFPTKLVPRTWWQPEWGLKQDAGYMFMKNIIEIYEDGMSFPLHNKALDILPFYQPITCKHCGAKYNYYQIDARPTLFVRCPQCLKVTLQKAR
jgi:hypothetical protein